MFSRALKCSQVDFGPPWKHDIVHEGPQQLLENMVHQRKPSNLGSNLSLWRAYFFRLSVSAAFSKWSNQEGSQLSSTGKFLFPAPYIWVLNICAHSLHLLIPLFCYLKGQYSIWKGHAEVLNFGWECVFDQVLCKFHLPTEWIFPLL